MVFDPHRHVTVASGAFSVDVNELNAAHAALTYEKLLAIGPSKAALTCAQLEVDLDPFRYKQRHQRDQHRPEFPG